MGPYQLLKGCRFHRKVRPSCSRFHPHSLGTGVSLTLPIGSFQRGRCLL